MALLIGVLLALAVGLLATYLSLDRDRAFYPVITIVIASYYALFAVMGATTLALDQWLLIQNQSSQLPRLFLKTVLYRIDPFT